MERRIIYDIAVNFIVAAVSLPFVLLLSGSTLLNIAALLYCTLLYRVSFTQNGKWLLREWMRSTLRIYKIMFG